MAIVIEEEKFNLLVRSGVREELILRILSNPDKITAVNAIHLERLEIMLKTGEYYHDMVISWVSIETASRALNVIDIERFRILFDNCMFHTDLMSTILANRNYSYLMNCIEMERFKILLKGGLYHKHVMVHALTHNKRTKIINHMSLEKVTQIFDNENVCGSSMITLFGQNGIIEQILLKDDPVQDQLPNKVSASDIISDYNRIISKARTRKCFSFLEKREAYRDAMLKKHIKRIDLIRTLKYIDRILAHINVIEAMLGIDLDKLLLLIQVDNMMPDNTNFLLEIGQFYSSIRSYNSVQIDRLRILMKNHTFSSKYVHNLVRIEHIVESINLLDIRKVELLADNRYNHDKTMELLLDRDAIRSFHAISYEDSEIILSNTDESEYMKVFADYKYGIRRNLDLTLTLFKAGQIDHISYDDLHHNQPLYDKVINMFPKEFPIDQLIYTCEENEKGLVRTLRDSIIDFMILTRFKIEIKSSDNEEITDVTVCQKESSNSEEVKDEMTDQTGSSNIVQDKDATVCERESSKSVEVEETKVDQTVSSGLAEVSDISITHGGCSGTTEVNDATVYQEEVEDAISDQTGPSSVEGVMDLIVYQRESSNSVKIEDAMADQVEVVGIANVVYAANDQAGSTSNVGVRDVTADQGGFGGIANFKIVQIGNGVEAEDAIPDKTLSNGLAEVMDISITQGGSSGTAKYKEATVCQKESSNSVQVEEAIVEQTKSSAIADVMSVTVDEGGSSFTAGARAGEDAKVYQKEFSLEVEETIADQAGPSGITKVKDVTVTQGGYSGDIEVKDAPVVQVESHEGIEVENAAVDQAESCDITEVMDEEVTQGGSTGNAEVKNVAGPSGILQGKDASAPVVQIESDDNMEVMGVAVDEQNSD